MTPDQLRRYIADAERADAAPSPVTLDDYDSPELEYLRTHLLNASPMVFAALCRLAVAAMEWRSVTQREGPEGWMPYGEAYDAALHTLDEMP